MKALLFFMLLFVSTAFAQRELFLKEYNEVNQFFFTHEKLELTQKFFYYSGSDASILLDTATSILVKYNDAIQWKFNEVESFSDSGYSIKISHPEKLMMVKKSAKADSSEIAFIFNEAFAGFNSFVKIYPAEGAVCWDLSESISPGIIAARIVFDSESRRINHMFIRFSSDHPLISAFINPDEKKQEEITIKIEYIYSSDGLKSELPKLSDYIVFSGSEIVPAKKFEDYKVQNVNLKK